MSSTELKVTPGHYECGVHAAFLACVEASARGIGYKPMSVGVSGRPGPSRVWRHLVYPLPMLEPHEVEWVMEDGCSGPTGDETAPASELDQEHDAVSDEPAAPPAPVALVASHDAGVEQPSVEVVSAVEAAFQEVASELSEQPAGDVTAQVEPHWLTQGLSEHAMWSGFASKHGNRLLNATTEPFESPRLFGLLCFMGRAVGQFVAEHAAEIETSEDGCSSASEQQTQFAGVGQKGVYLLDGKVWVTTERILRFSRDGELTGRGIVNLRRSANANLHEAAELGWLERMGRKIPGGTHVNLWAFLPEGIEYLGAGLVARDRMDVLLGGYHAERTCADLGLDEREERRQELQERRTLAGMCDVDGPKFGKRDVCTRKALADLVSQDAIEKARRRVEQARGAVLWSGLIGRA